MREVSNYKEKVDIFENDFLLTNLEDQKPKPSWWKNFCGTTEVSKIAVEILNISVTTAAKER